MLIAAYNAARSTSLSLPSLAGLVVFAGSLYPIPSRTRPLNSPAPMVLSLKAWKSRSLPGLPRTDCFIPLYERRSKAPRGTAGLFCCRSLHCWNRRACGEVLLQPEVPLANAREIADSRPEDRQPATEICGAPICRFAGEGVRASRVRSSYPDAGALH